MDIFGKGGGEALAKDMELPFLGAIPLDPKVREAGDSGVPPVRGTPDSPAAMALKGVAQAVRKALEGVGQG